MKEQSISPSSRHAYIPLVPVNRATLRYSVNRIPVATTTTPQVICGEARRIGYTGKLDTDLALYRLKIKPGNNLPTITLPSLYIIDNGVFQDYEEWRQRNSHSS